MDDLGLQLPNHTLALVQLAIDRPRPLDVRLLIPGPAVASWPSGHATFASAASEEALTPVRTTELADLLADVVGVGVAMWWASRGRR